MFSVYGDYDINFFLQLVLADIQSNPSIANILPDLAQYLEETVSHVITEREVLYCAL